jgi:WD40 repeat protein
MASPHSSRTVTHRTGIPIAAIDINKSKTHAILAGKEILKTVRIHDGKITEDFNLRASISSYASAHISAHSDSAEKRREYLPARDVKWSMGHWEHIVATAGTNGRIALYDLNAPSAKTEWAWLHEHTGQINKLDIDPHAGYLLLSASQDKSVRLWDLREPKPEKSRTRFEVRSAVRDVCWSPVEPFDFAVCADGGFVQKWDARAPMLPKLSINAHEKACYSLEYHPDGRHVISGGFDKYIRVWDFESDKKRQKPVRQLKAPHAIKNIRWRPACSILESEETNLWQSTQVAVSYYHDDPRVHIWDLRRPWLPFRELDEYTSPANDLLWADKDLLWTVADDGIFTQWDVRHNTPLYNQLAPCTSQFVPDGRYYSFSEDREMRHATSHGDTAVGFLSVPRDKLSSGDDGLASRSLTDDEGGLETTGGTSARRHETTAMSSRSNKSQTNSPPSMDQKPPILSLDEAILTRPDLFNNDQVGADGYVPGVAAEAEVVEYLASHYATPATAETNSSSPDTILHRLQDVFHQNAAACDMVGMHRTAQTWRILGTVIVPELKDWADANRARRRADAARRKETLESFRSGARRPGLSPLAGLPDRGHNSHYDSKGHKLISSLFRGVAEGDRLRAGLDVDSTSNMTTPLAKPLPNSPPTDDKKWAQANIEDRLDNLPPLPPSVLSSHSTAAAAARALMNSPDQVPRLDMASPELHKSTEAAKKPSETTGALVSPVKRPKSDSLVDQKHVPGQKRSQEDRRAALRDYRAQARPILSLGDPIHKEASGPRHDSAESFPMFSVSTDSSQKVQSVGRSLESPRGTGKASLRRQPSDLSSDNDDDFDGTYSYRSVDRSSVNRRATATSAEPSPGVSAIERPLQMRFGLDGQTSSSEEKSSWRAPREDRDNWHAHREHELILPSQLDTAVSSSPDIFHFEAGASVPKPRIHTSNPIRSEPSRDNDGESTHANGAGLLKSLSLDELDCATYLPQDFRPIDLSKYEPKRPFAWSSLPLICQCISFDLESGIAHAQFSAHLLMHVHQYFFHPSFRNMKRVPGRAVDNLADRLMTPQLGHRVIGSIFERHVLFLTQMGLFEPAALLRKMCVEFEYPQIYQPASEGKRAASGLPSGDGSTLSVVCSDCQAPLSAGRNTCERCRRVRAVCPICESLEEGYKKGPDTNMATNTPLWGQKNSMWMCCQACGHSGHVRCLMEWFSQHSSEGRCPTPGCGCDCGPGLTREHRIEQQIKREDEVKLIRGTSPGHNTSGSTKRDPLKAAPSPAVDKARAALRNSFAAERTTQSGDERSLPGRRASGRGRTSGFSSSRKSVRLVTPGEEEDGHSQSKS